MAFANLWRRIAPLYGSATLLGFVAGSAWAQAPATVTADMQRLLDANAWQLEYRLSFTASSSGSGKSLTGPVTFQSQLSSDATETLVLGERSQGASLTMQKVVTNASKPGGAADMQKALMDIAMQSDNIASWMLGADLPDLGDEPTVAQLQAAALARARASIGTQTVEYSAETRGDKLFDETGAPYKQIVRTTTRGSGGVRQGSQQITLEVNGATKRLLLMVPATLPIVLDAALTEEVVTVTESPPGSRPSEERKTSKPSLESFPGQLRVTDAALAFGEGGLMIDDPVVLQGGKVSAQHTVAATYGSNNAPIAGMLVVKYTLTPR
jgi:hypothetical protein